MKLTLIIAMVFAVASARIEVTETLDGSLIEMIDDVLAPNPFRDSSGIFKRSLLEGGLRWDSEVAKRERRQLVVNCRPGSTARTAVLPGTTQVNCVKVPDVTKIDCGYAAYAVGVTVNCK